MCYFASLLKTYRGKNELNWNGGKILFLLFSLWESLFFLKSFLGNPSSKDPSCPLALNILLLLLIFIFSLLSFYFITILLLFKSMTCRARPSHLTVASSRWSMPPRPQITAGIHPFFNFFSDVSNELQVNLLFEELALDFVARTVLCLVLRSLCTPSFWWRAQTGGLPPLMSMLDWWGDQSCALETFFS